jgi:radical SAM protein with 4Fe4S-binding SPASM domain
MYPHIQAEFMTRDVYTRLLKWLVDSKVNSFHLMGGEPTVHQDFIWMLKTASEMKFTVDVFSNGITEFSEVEMKVIKAQTRFWIVNVNNPKNYSESQRGKLEQLFRVLGNQTTITFNVTNADYDSFYVIDYINHYNLIRNVKLGIALPTLNQKNEFANPAEFKELSQTVLELSGKLKNENIKGEFECGVPYCFFDENQKEIINENNFGRFSQCCSILDILPDGNVIYCLPLAKLLKKHYSQFPAYQDLWSFFQDYYRPYRSVGYKKACLDCKWKKECNGSCLSRIIPHFRQDEYEAQN